MNVANFNEKLRFIVENGDLSINGLLYREYSDAFDEWYGDPIWYVDNVWYCDLIRYGNSIWYGDPKSYAGPVLEEYLIDPGYPESDFREWVASRLLNVGDEDPEISVEHLEKEIERIKNARKD